MLNKPMRAKCHMCGGLYMPDPEFARARLENDDFYDPTDWICPDCIKASDEIEDMIIQAHMDAIDKEYQALLDSQVVEDDGWLASDYTAGADGGMEGESE